MPGPRPPLDPDQPAPQRCPSPRELDDLELLLSGALAPLSGFTGPEQGLTLRVPPATAEQATRAGALELVDPEGLPLARLRLEHTYPAGDQIGLVGAVEPLDHPAYGPFRRLHLTPEQVHQAHDESTLTVPASAALSGHDLAQIAERAEGRGVLLLALCGTGTPRHLSPVGLVRATLAAATHLPDAEVVAVPLAARGEATLDRDLADRVAAAYAPGEVLTVSGEGDPPEDVAAAVRQDRPPRSEQGLVVFFTGLSGSGKSTLARALHDLLLERGERTVTGLDGDVVRRHLSAGLGFSREDRATNIARIGWVAAEVSRHGGVAIASPIAPFDATRRRVREMAEDAGGGFVLVHVATPLAECERRDRKGLYARARRGEIADFTGISSPYEEPEDADVRVDTTGRSVPEVLDEVLAVLRAEGYLP